MHGLTRTSLFDDLFQSFDDLFGSVPAERSAWAPKVDISEQEDRYLIEAELPGVTNDDISITVNDGRLTISGEKKSQREIRNDKERTYRRECYVGRFSRHVAIGELVDQDAITAKLSNGILLVELPKRKQIRSKGKSIPIQSQ